MAPKKRERWLTGWMQRELFDGGLYWLTIKGVRREEDAAFCPKLFHRATDYRLPIGAPLRKVRIRVIVEEI